MSEAHDAVMSALSTERWARLRFALMKVLINPVRKGFIMNINFVSKMKHSRDSFYWMSVAVKTDGNFCAEQDGKVLSNVTCPERVHCLSLGFCGNLWTSNGGCKQWVPEVFTHLFNCHEHWQAGARRVGALLQNRQTNWCGLIADGHHVAPALYESAIAGKGCAAHHAGDGAIQSVWFSWTRSAFFRKKVVAVMARSAQKMASSRGLIWTWQRGSKYYFCRRAELQQTAAGWLF